MEAAGGDWDVHYQFLLNYFPADTIFLRFKTLWTEIVTIVKAHHLEKAVIIDEESLQMMILDYFTDIARIRHFQQIERANVCKIYGYELYWFVRRRPIQIVQPRSENFAINEKVAILLFIPKILRDTGFEYTKASENPSIKAEIGEFANLLFYNLKYRTFTQKSLELMIEAFSCGRAIK